MQDLNDLFYLTQVLTHGGFSPASRVLRIPKSTLSRRIALLEERLGVRLIERSSRRFQVTEIGKAYCEQAQIAVAAAERAQALVEASLSEPRGLVRFSCPTGLLEIVAPLVPDFLSLYPRARLQIVATDRPVDLIGERIDVALRVRVKLDTDATLILRTLGYSRRILLASPMLANQIGDTDIAELETLPLLSSSNDGGEVDWTLEGPGDRTYSCAQLPRFGCGDFSAVRNAAIAGLGVALLPDHVCAAALASGALVRVFKEWQGQAGIVHLVFTTRTGLPPVVRLWIDHLVAGLGDGFARA